MVNRFSFVSNVGARWVAALFCFLPVVGLSVCRPKRAIAPAPAQEIPVADGFDYPVGKTRAVTQKRDGDGWYNAQDFTENQHLAEDWNGEGGGNTDCGEPVYAAARGVVVWAENAWGWGNVVIARHRLPEGKEVETQYAHLKEIKVKVGDQVERRQLIGTVGDGDGRFLCHLHFEARTPECRDWGAPGAGYSGDTTGWLDPSDFIDKHRPPR